MRLAKRIWVWVTLFAVCGWLAMFGGWLAFYFWERPAFLTVQLSAYQQRSGGRSGYRWVFRGAVDNYRQIQFTNDPTSL